MSKYYIEIDGDNFSKHSCPDTERVEKLQKENERLKEENNHLRRLNDLKDDEIDGLRDYTARFRSGR